MKTRKKFRVIYLVILCMVFIFIGCGKNNETVTDDLQEINADIDVANGIVRLGMGYGTNSFIVQYFDLWTERVSEGFKLFWL